MTPLNIAVWFNTARVRKIGSTGCSSHSGRRTSSPGWRGWFTGSAARCVMSSCSLATGRSKRPSGTSHGDTDAQRKLVAMIDGMISRTATCTNVIPSRQQRRSHRNRPERRRQSITLFGSYTMSAASRAASLIGDDNRADLRAEGTPLAIRRHDTATLFDWLVSALSYQGISADQVASDYMERHGSATWADIEAKVAASPTCPKLQSHRHLHGCRYDKISRTCSEPDHIDGYPLPTHQLRNGRLNEMAYSLFLFVGNIADGDLVGWIDRQFQDADITEPVPNWSPRLWSLGRTAPGGLRRLGKVLTMTLSCVLMAAPKRLHLWQQVGASMIAVDTLVHNFLVRTGILGKVRCRPFVWCSLLSGWRLRRHHRGRGGPYSDARQFNPGFPHLFPRFVQHAIWR